MTNFGSLELSVPPRLRTYAAIRPAPVKRETVIETVARRFESLVRSGELKSGSRLPPEPELARMLQVSRSSLREALKGMVFLGIIKARPGDGTYIQPFSGRIVSKHFRWMLLLQEIKYLELYELRKVLEPEVAALAARRATKADLEQMEAAILGMKESVTDPEEFMRQEIEFHQRFAQASNNAAIQAMLQMMYDAIAEGRRRVLPLIEDMERHYLRHERIFRSIREHNAERARAAVIDDLRYAEGLLRKDLAVQDQLRETLQSIESTRPKKISKNQSVRTRTKTAVRKPAKGEV